MRLLLLLLLSFLCSRVPAQVLTVSEEIPLRTDTEYRLIGKLGGHVLLLQDRNTKHLLTGYGRNMNQNWEKELELRGRNIRILEQVADPDGTGFSLLYLFRDRGRNHLQLDRYNPAGNLQDSVTLVQFNPLADMPQEEEIYRSEDQSKLLLLITEPQQRVRYLGVDLRKRELLYDNVTEPDKFFFNDDFLQAEITNAGDMIFVIERDNFRSRRKNHRYEVLHATAGATTLTSRELSLGDSLTYDVVFRYDNRNQRLSCGGLYSTRDFLRADGYFFATFDPRGSGTVHPHYRPFGLALIKNVEGKRFNKRRPSLDELTVRQAILRQDGGLVLITERNRQLQRRSSAAQAQIMNTYGGRPLVDHHYNEIIAFSIHPDGREHWTNVMHKKQYSQDDGGIYSSFFLLESPRSLRFLFNDEIRFENTVSEYVMNGRGEFDRNSLFHTRDLELRLRFRDAVQVAANELVVPSEHRNRLRLVKMTYGAK